VVSAYKKRIEKLEAKDEDKLTKSEKRMLTQLRNSLKSLESEGDDNRTAGIDQLVDYMTSRLRIINSIAVTDQDVFIVCGESKGYGYALWRMDRNFENAKQIKGEMRGCCGQMDVQVQGSDVLVARELQPRLCSLRSRRKSNSPWSAAKNSRGQSQLFGGCCNPMNCRAGADGDVYTAESEGIIKRFSNKGDLKAIIGQRPLSGGCKERGRRPSTRRQDGLLLRHARFEDRCDGRKARRCRTQGRAEGEDRRRQSQCEVVGNSCRAISSPRCDPEISNW
jgi:hypothetical protein